ncbi:MAG: hypothetical protein EAZ65_04695 [Verrucomicrobia bacterium]|nr:MAG: hypothetical protein EAZ84_00915 [Verrucomicrobiota bacterium]TAE88040.1 MAG: hypothetical protein EAZ82_05950 [Verrucomicrobiota bacterium]TAF26264.1 MAG: hypothetical protein EAZ71_05515 [Verrucomicrobiota bacterium]TAF41818.1 MAG: hypothetical protein EAZ65_04695 [Verrucomicrobiota bacterium]
MSDPNDDIKRWAARRKATAVRDIIKGKTTAAELARSHDLTVAGIEQVRHAKTWLTGRGIPALSMSYADLVHRTDEALPLLATLLGR